MIMRPMGASMGMLTMAMVAKWAFTLGATLATAGVLGLFALRRAMSGRGRHAADPIHGTAMPEAGLADPGADAVT